MGAPEQRRIRLGRLPVDAVTFPEALDAIARMIEGATGGTVFTPNVDHVVMADGDERFSQAYQTATLSLADGMPVLWASRLFGEPLPKRSPARIFVMPLMQRAEREGWRVYLLGGAPGDRRAGREASSSSFAFLASWWLERTRPGST